MVKFILGEKVGMGEVFDEKGAITPVTLIKAGPCKVTQIKTKEKDGYSAIQVGFGEAKKLKKPQEKQLKKVGKLKNLREVRISEEEEKKFKVGDEIKIDIFKEGDRVAVSGLSKGKGFAGVVKRHGFKGGPATHGHRHALKKSGSIGSAFPERVFKGKKMPGRMGAKRVTVKNLKVMQIDKDKNILAIRGAIPGRKGTLLEIKEK